MKKFFTILIALSLLQVTYNSGKCCDCDNYTYKKARSGLQNYCDKEPIKIRQRLTLYDIETSKGLYR